MINTRITVPHLMTPILFFLFFLSENSVGAGANERLKCYPNPYRPENGQMTIEYAIFSSESVSSLSSAVATIYDLSWRKVQVLRSPQLKWSSGQNGKLVLKWDGKNSKGYRVRPGLYICVLKLGEKEGRTQRLGEHKFARFVVLP